MAELADLLTAIDTYMQNNGAGQSYLAKKLGDLFESKKSPFNVKEGPLKDVGDSLKQLAKRLDALEKSAALKTFQTTFLRINKNLETLNLFINKVKGAFSRLEKHLQNVVQNHRTSTQPKTPSGRIVGIINTKIINFDALVDKLKKQPLPVRIEGIGDFTLNKIVMKFILELKRMRAAENALRPPPLPNSGGGGGGTTIINNIYNQAAPPPPSADQEEKGSILGTILAVLAAITAIGAIGSFLEKSPVGRFIKKKIKDAFDYLLDKTSKFFVDTLVPAFLDGLKYLFQGVVEFFKSTFNFYGLKEKLGPQGSGFATILTKVIFKTVMRITKAIGDFFSFGWFSKGLEKLEQMFTVGIPKLVDKLPASFGKGGLKVITTIGMKVMKPLLKVLKFIPFIGSLISFASAYDRFKKGEYITGIIDVAVGIANFFPGVGTAIAIGLDVVNAMLDYQGGKQGLTGNELVGTWWDSIFKWISPKLSFSNLRNFPGIGGLIRIAEGIGKLESNTLDGIKEILMGIVWLTPIGIFGFWANLFGFLDLAESGGKMQPNPNVTPTKNWVDDIKDWFKEKLSYEKLKTYPVIGAVIKLGESIWAFVGSPTTKNLQGIFESLGNFITIPFIGQLLGFLSWIDSPTSTKNTVSTQILNLINPTKMIEKVASFMGGLINGFLDIFGGIVSSAKAKIGSFKSKVESMFGDDKSADMDESLRMKLIGKLSQKSKENDELKKQVAELQSQVKSNQYASHMKVNDAIIVEPHSKDQVLMAKAGGPIDVALKKMNETLDDLASICIEGFTGVVQATTSSGSSVAQAVVASASSGQSSGGYNTGSGGTNPIQDSRDRSSRAIERFGK